jgi:RNA polymerase sigma factor (sigma-70 family)
MTVDEYNQSVDLYSDNIYRFLLKNTKDADKSKDIVQDTYEKLWLKVSDVSFTKVKSYLFTSAYHTFIDLCRREKFRGEMTEVNVSKYAHSEQYSDLNEVLHQALQQLPEDQRSTVLLRDYEGYSYEEIAEITGLSDAQVKVYIFRGRLFLRNYIGKLETII